MKVWALILVIALGIFGWVLPARAGKVMMTDQELDGVSGGAKSVVRIRRMPACNIAAAWMASRVRRDGNCLRRVTARSMSLRRTGRVTWGGGVGRT